MFTGCETFLKASEIYAKYEQKHTFIMMFFRKYVIYGSAVILAPTLLQPVCYLIFGFPTPDKWQQLVPMK